MDEEEWKTAYDVQIYVTSLSAISDCNWNRLELWVNFHQDGFIYKLRHYSNAHYGQSGQTLSYISPDSHIAD